MFKTSLNMRKYSIIAFLSLQISLLVSMSAKAQTPQPSTADNSTVIVQTGTTELRFSEVSYFGPNSHWEINGTLEIWSKQIWIAPTARFSGTGKIIIHNPGDNPYYEQMAAGPTQIDGNDGEFIGVTIELRKTSCWRTSTIRAMGSPCRKEMRSLPP